MLAEMRVSVVCATAAVVVVVREVVAKCLGGPALPAVTRARPQVSRNYLNNRNSLNLLRRAPVPRTRGRLHHHGRSAGARPRACGRKRRPALRAGRAEAGRGPAVVTRCLSVSSTGRTGPGREKRASAAGDVTELE